MLWDALSTHFPGADNILKGAVPADFVELDIRRPPANAGHTRIIRADGHYGSPCYSIGFVMNISPKQALRAKMRERRVKLAQEGSFAAEALATLFFQSFSFPSETLIGGYWPLGSELDIRLLLEALACHPFPCALPCIEGEELIFRSWIPEDRLTVGPYGIQEPVSTAPVVVPDVLLVPLLAFDRQGHRLGYGRGFYDRYLTKNSVTSIGVGFAGQEVDAIPYDSHDMLLTFVLTDKESIKPQS